MTKLFLIAASLSGLLSVALGAFGAHGLKSRLSETMLNTWQTAVQYQMMHTLALIGVALLMARLHDRQLLNISGIAFIVGIVFFSGSLYWLALGGPRWLGPITPLGGLAFLVGWAALFIAALRS